MNKDIVFVDTSIYIAEKYFAPNNRILALRNLAGSGIIKLVLSNAPAGHDRGSQSFLWLEGRVAAIHSVPLGTQHKKVECRVPKGTPDTHQTFFQP